MHQVYQSRMMSQQYSDYSGHVASTGSPSEQNGPQDVSSEQDDRETDLQNLPGGEQPMDTETHNVVDSTNDDMQTVETNGVNTGESVNEDDSNIENSKMEE
ncbi:uncharacterized protein LOC143587373 [Bidens hawaiensis]|uniref:uncharacterized protein LOC143587373 n=1 Tax=Bidens hawaiensis TaxID=980011 RepID=UPI00404B5133